MLTHIASQRWPIRKHADLLKLIVISNLSSIYCKQKWGQNRTLSHTKENRKIERPWLIPFNTGTGTLIHAYWIEWYQVHLEVERQTKGYACDIGIDSVYKLQKMQLSMILENIFTERIIVNLINSLPSLVVKVPSLNCFKARLDKF